jgi:hypothetical protein
MESHDDTRPPRLPPPQISPWAGRSNREVPPVIIIPRRPVVTGGTWTPANLTRIIDLDATDNSTVTTVSGAVSLINDKSGNSRNASQATASARPTYVTSGVNGRPVIRFPTGGQLLSLANISTVSNSYIVALMREGNGNITPLIDFAASYSYIHYANTMSVANATPVTNPVPMNANTWYINIWDGANAYSNGTSYGGAPASTLASTFSTINSSFSNNAWNLARVIVLPGQITTDNRQRAEGYLAHHLGIAAALPSGHLYKSSPP